MCRRVRVEEIADKSLYFPGTTLERGKSLNGKYTRGPFTLHSHSQSSAQSHFYPISINFSIAAKYEESQNHCTVIIIIIMPPLDEKRGIITEKVIPVFSDALCLLCFSHVNLGVTDKF